MSQAHSARSRLIGFCLSGALLLVSAPALRAGGSTQPNPVTTFSTHGLKKVTLEVCNAGLCSSVIKEVTVLDPRPVVTSGSFAPLLPEAGQLILLTGTGKGKPPLAYGWQVARVGGTSPLISVPYQSFWWNTSGWAPGSYTVTLQVQNSVGVENLVLPLVLAPAAALDYYTVEPCRIYDSRLAAGALVSGIARSIQATGTCGIPAGARALTANVTVVGPTGTGNATLYPGNYPQPNASTISFEAGTTRASHAVLPLATDGGGTLTALASIAGSGSAHVAIDVSGYFAP